jgi:surface protein
MPKIKKLQQNSITSEPKKNYTTHLTPEVYINNNINLLEKYEELQKIGEGGFGRIYSAKRKNDGKKVCLKFININKNNDYKNEIEIMKLLSEFENSVKYYGEYKYIKENGDQEIIIEMEKCDMDLKKFIQEKLIFKVEDIKKFLFGINKVFKYMQEKKIIHRDLKLENILVKYDNNSGYTFKLSDYGNAKIQNNSYSLKGTLETIAPEIFIDQGNKYDSKIDIFSLGIILYQISHPHKIENNELIFQHPFNNNINCYINYFKKDNFNISFDKKITNENFKNLVTRMLKLNPKNRISWEDYFNHDFFKENNSYNSRNCNDGILSCSTNNTEIRDEARKGPGYISKKFFMLPFNCKSLINMNFMFSQCRMVNLDLSSFVVQKVKNLKGLFCNCKNLRIVKFSKNFNTENVTDMSFMFFGCENLEELDLSTFNLQNVEQMTAMFYNCVKMEKLSLPVSNVKKDVCMRSILYNCKKEIKIINPYILKKGRNLREKLTDKTIKNEIENNN